MATLAMPSSAHTISQILLADDDEDDCILFEDALRELTLPYQLVIAKNGHELMQNLYTGPSLPDILFLDLNMPLKGGLECLIEIKQHKDLRNLPVIILSTSAQPHSVEDLYKKGASLYVRKPSTFKQLKEMISEVLSIDWLKGSRKITRENFLYKP